MQTTTAAQELTDLLAPIINSAESGESAVMECIEKVNACYGERNVRITHGHGIPTNWSHPDVAVFVRAKTLLGYTQIVAHHASSAIKIWKLKGRKIAPYCKVIVQGDASRTMTVDAVTKARNYGKVSLSVTAENQRIATQKAQALLNWSNVKLFEQSYAGDTDQLPLLDAHKRKPISDDMLTYDVTKVWATNQPIEMVFIAV